MNVTLNTPTDFLRSILESPKGMVIFTLDKNYRYTSFSESHRAVMKSIWGVDITLGINMLECIRNEDDRIKAKLNFDKALHGEYFTQVEEYGDAAAHVRTFYENRYGPVKDQSGQTIGVSVFVIDISELKQTEQALQISQQQLHAVLDAIPDKLFKINAQGYFLELLSAKPKHNDRTSFVGKSVFEIFPQGIASLYISAIHRCLNHQSIQSIDYEINDENLAFAYETRFIPFSQREVLVLIRDNSEKKKNEKELLKLSLIAENTSNIIVITDEQGKIEWVNDAFTRITEYPLSEVIGKKPGSLLQGKETDAATSTYIREKVNAKEPFNAELINYTKSGRKYWIHINAQPIFDASGQVTKFFAIETDITERKNAEIKIIEQNARLMSIMENLTRKNEQLEEFTQIVSHNLRSPIGNISALIEHLNSIEDPADRVDIINHLKISTNSIMLTLQELNEVLKIKYAGNIARDVISLQGVYEKVCGMLITQIHEIGADVTANFRNAPSVLYPSIYAESIVLNLLSNALKYFSPERKPVINFESWIENDCVMMKVSDTGLGIDLERYGHQVFKLRKTFHRHPESRGVGLFLIKNQIEAMHGTISIASDTKIGTTFTVNFGAHSYAK
jgi:PAS domain S-box-containing protein